MAWRTSKIGARRGRQGSAARTPPVRVGPDHSSELTRLRRLEAERQQYFHQLVTGESVEIILRGLAEGLETEFPGSRVALRVPGQEIFFATRPDSNDQILMEAASFATAAVPTSFGTTPLASPLMTEIAVADISCDPAWEAQRALAASLDYGCCWTVPIPSNRASVGAAIFLLMPGLCSPSQEEQAMLRATCAQAGIALDQHQLGQELTHQSLHDVITGLPNRVLLQDRLTQAIGQAARQSEQLGVFLLDIDGFKFINETLGQTDGDSLLKAIADRLQSSVRRSDTLARLKGDEFIFVASNMDQQRGSATVADKLLATLSKPFIVDGRELFLSASIGASIYPLDGTDGPTLLRCAEAALARAKVQGRGALAFFAPDMNAAALERLQLEGELRHAIKNEEFRLHYQPQVDFRGECVAVEALIRWQHPRLGMLAPGRFISIAEQSGLILEIGEWVMREACRQLQRWNNNPRLSKLRIAVNVSALQFERATFVDDVRRILAETRIDPSRLELEITESLLMGGSPDEADKIASLRRIGVTLAIDDFGTGYSSLAYLHRLPIDTLKIDRAFVKSIDADTTEAECLVDDPDAETSSRTAVIRAILSLGRSLGINILAEGVETERQRQFLVRHGCEMMQGYLFGKPVAPDEIERAMANPATLAKSA